MKAVIISVKPYWCEKIASGKKTIEVRKTKPKIETPFKCYIYCSAFTKYFSVAPHLSFGCDELWKDERGSVRYGDSLEVMTYENFSKDNFLNRKVIGEFTCDLICAVLAHPVILGGHPLYFKKAIEDACLTESEVDEYSGGKDVYGWHISDLKIYDKPKDLSEFLVEDNRTYDCPGLTPLKHPPQSWMYVEDLK